MGAAFVETSRPVRLALASGAVLFLLLTIALLADLGGGLGHTGDELQRWCTTLATALAAMSVALRVGEVERERRAWLPICAGLFAYTLGWLLWTAVYRDRPH